VGPSLAKVTKAFTHYSGDKHNYVVARKSSFPSSQNACMYAGLPRHTAGRTSVTIKTWDASSSECLQTINVGKLLFHISFDTNTSCFHTDSGNINISNTPSSSRMLSTYSGSQNPHYEGLVLGINGVWITYDSDDVVWLPSDYRPSRSAGSEDTIGVGTTSGRVWICKMKVNVF
jgi:hypothetical protein